MSQGNYELLSLASREQPAAAAAGISWSVGWTKRNIHPQ
jgi:hypothetical protein